MIIPHYLAIGLTLGEIRHSTLSDLHYYDEAYMLRREMQDELLWLNGIYTLEAFRVVLSNAFQSKNTLPEKYRDKPIMTEIREKNRVLTEEEKEEQIKLLFGNLEMMQKNFEKNKKEH